MRDKAWEQSVTNVIDGMREAVKDMRDKAEQIDWDALEEPARQAYMKNQVVIDWGDFWEGYVAGYLKGLKQREEASDEQPSLDAIGGQGVEPAGG